jgi:hypothetical protein
MLNQTADIKKVLNAKVVEGFIKALVSRKTLTKLVVESVKQYESLIPEIAKHYEGKIYEKLCHKFRPWICLKQMDFSATVSFRAYDKIRKIEFNEDPDGPKYKRGLLHSRHKLSQVCKQLENFGCHLLPYKIDENSIKFDIPVVVQFLMEKHGLWQRMVEGEKVVMAATVDGGELAWKVMQISAGIKFANPHTKDPLTGQLLFGDTGYKNCSLVPLVILCMYTSQRIQRIFMWSI